MKLLSLIACIGVVSQQLELVSMLKFTVASNRNFNMSTNNIQPYNRSNRFEYLDSNPSGLSWNSIHELNKIRQAEFYSSGFPTPILYRDLYARYYFYKNIVKKEYSKAICAFGVEEFMSYAAYFCRYEALNGTLEVISVGSGNGTVEGSIIAAYKQHFGYELEKITLVDKNPEYAVDYSSVNDLIEKRPNVRGNCVLLIIWPETPILNDGYDIDSICKLKPRAVFALYETTGVSGSENLTEFLNYGEPVNWRCEDDDKTLDNYYAIEELAYQEVHMNGGDEEPENYFHMPLAGSPEYKFRMVKLKRKDVPNLSHFAYV